MLQSDTDVLVTSEGHLLIGQARPQDTGNYTCVAENIAAKRMAPTSQIIVYGKGLDLDGLGGEIWPAAGRTGLVEIALVCLGGSATFLYFATAEFNYGYS